jgi:hypothetical protein
MFSVIGEHLGSDGLAVDGPVVELAISGGLHANGSQVLGRGAVGLSMWARAYMA